jgi:hypothetical protein
MQTAPHDCVSEAHRFALVLGLWEPNSLLFEAMVQIATLTVAFVDANGRACSNKHLLLAAEGARHWHTRCSRSLNVGDAFSFGVPNPNRATAYAIQVQNRHSFTPPPDVDRSRVAVGLTVSANHNHAR